MITVQDVTRIYRRGRQEIVALRGVTLSIAPGELVGIVGRSGSGKSTLLHLLGALDTPTSGRVFFEEQNLAALSDRERALLRRNKIGFIFQFFNLLPTLNAVENVALPLQLGATPRSTARACAREVLEQVGLGRRASHYPEELSGGEMQRVAIARALVTDPPLVLCDEPTGSLDSATAREVLAILAALPQAGKRAVVLVTHDPQVASRADRIIQMQDGRADAGPTGRGQDVRAVSIA